MDGHHSDTLVIGAGMAGLACATRLAAAGHAVTVIDKGRGPGGRMAARRAEVAGAATSFDHGAQYFTARDPAFRDAVAAWTQAGVAAQWPAAGEEAWVGTPGMNAPIRAMAEPLNVRWNVRAESIGHDGTCWTVGAAEHTFTADTLVVAVPAEQAQVLLAEAAPELAILAGVVRSSPCWAAMASFAAPLPIASDCLRSDTVPISWAARNSAKPGRGGPESWVIHASPARSRELLELGKDEAARHLLADFFALAGVEPVEPLHLDAHRWLYALPQALGGEGARFDPASRIGIAGDYLHSPRVEGAWLSGTTLAAVILVAS